MPGARELACAILLGLGAAGVVAAAAAYAVAGSSQERGWFALMAFLALLASSLPLGAAALLARPRLGPSRMRPLAGWAWLAWAALLLAFTAGALASRDGIDGGFWATAAIGLLPAAVGAAAGALLLRRPHAPAA